MYKGKIGNFPVCVLIDTGATNSFINPVVVKEMNLTAVSMPSKVFRSAGGERLVTDKICLKVKFKVQGHQLEADLRILNVPGYDIVLGCDWVAEQDDIIINLKKGIVTLELGGKWIELLIENVKAEIRVQEDVVDVVKEKKRGGQVFVAQLFSLKEEVRQPDAVETELQEVID